MNLTPPSYTAVSHPNRDLDFHRILIWTILMLEAVFIITTLKSFALGAIFITIPIGIFVLMLVPELGFAVALTGNVLIMILFDSVKVDVIAPVIIAYLSLLIIGSTFYLFQQPPIRDVRFGKLIILSFLIGIVMAISILYSPNPAAGMRKTQFFFLMNIPLVVLPIIFYRDPSKLRNIIIIAYFLGLGLAILTTYLALSAPSGIRFRPSESVNPIWLARSLGTTVLAGLFVAAFYKTRLLRIAIIASIPLFLFPILQTGSRAPFIGLLLAGILFYLLQPGGRFRKKVFLISLSALAVLTILVASSSILVQRLLNPNVSDMVSTALRIPAWIQAIQDFAASPLLGIGTGGYYLDFSSLPIVFYYPHNLFLEMASENGVIGLSLMLAFIFLSFKYGIANRRSHRAKAREEVQLSAILLSLLSYSLWNAMFSGDIRSNEGIWLAAGMIWTLWVSKSVQESERFPK